MARSVTTESTEEAGKTAETDAPVATESQSPMRVTVPGVTPQRPLKPMASFDPSAYDFLKDEDIQISPEDGTVVVHGTSRDEALNVAANIIAVAGGDFEIVSSYDEAIEETDPPSWKTVIRRKG